MIAFNVKNMTYHSIYLHLQISYDTIISAVFLYLGPWMLCWIVELNTWCFPFDIMMQTVLWLNCLNSHELATSRLLCNVDCKDIVVSWNTGNWWLEEVWNERKGVLLPVIIFWVWNIDGCRWLLREALGTTVMVGLVPIRTLLGVVPVKAIFDTWN